MDQNTRRYFAAGLLLALATAPAQAQLLDQIPSAPYFVAVQGLYSGEYRDAERELRRETQRGVRAGQTRWVDAVCYHAMLGEALYNQGRNQEALASFDQACNSLLAYPNFLLQVKFQQAPRPDTNRARRAPPWGQSQRQFVLGLFPDTEQVLIGDFNAEQTIRQGGVLRQPMYLRVNVVEVFRSAALAIRRRGELLGPLARHDPITKELSDAFARGNLSPANHWSGAWIDLLRGLTQAGIGRLDEADMLLQRSLVVDGRYDHPLTCIALLEQGRIAMTRGDGSRASQLLAEAAYSAFYYENWDVLTESILLGWINHIAAGGGGVYAPLEPVAAWAQVNRLQHVAVKLRLAQAESLLSANQLAAASTILDDVSRRLGEMRTGLPGVQMQFLQAAGQILSGKLKPGGELLVQALAAQANVSLRNFQIGRTNSMYDSRIVTPRIAVDVYTSLLADPSPADWVVRPADTMAVLGTVHDASFDRWFIAALERKEALLALEIAELAKRRRYLASRPLGGRIAALRSILEAPTAELSRDAVLQRQQIMALAPAYRTLSEAGQKIYEQLRTRSPIASDASESKKLAALYDEWAKNAGQRQLMLAQLAVRRIPSSLEFPPRLPAGEMQKKLNDGEALVVFHSVAGRMYGFLVAKNDAVLWQLQDPRRLRGEISGLLQAMGNFGSSRQISMPELSGDKWRDAAAKTFTSIFADSRLDIASTKSLIVVPDEVLWYLPFEALIPDAAKPETLADRVLIRYGPTAALAVSNPLPLRRPQRTGIVATPKVGDENAMPNAEMLAELEKTVIGPVRLPSPLPEPARLVWPLLDEFIGFDAIQSDAPTAYGWSPLPKSRGAGNDELSAWFGLPFGGPERVLISGFTTAAEQGLKGSRRSGSGRNGRPGDEIFQSLCGLMGDGARTILLTRWRTGGRTNFELMREFARELSSAPANEAWQRACLLARETPVEIAQEPRLKRIDETGELPTADHPFFWAGYLLVDTSPAEEEPGEAVEPETVGTIETGKAESGSAENALPPPDAADGPQAPAGESADAESKGASEDENAGDPPGDAPPSPVDE